VPYELTFRKPLAVPDASHYINDCCWGGDVIRDELSPLISTRYERIRTGQEDWGWYLWFRHGAVDLAVDIYCDDPKSGLFRIHLTSKRKVSFFRKSGADTPELAQLLDLITTHLKISAITAEVRHF